MTKHRNADIQSSALNYKFGNYFKYVPCSFTLLFPTAFTSNGSLVTARQKCPFPSPKTPGLFTTRDLRQGIRCSNIKCTLRRKVEVRC